MVDHVLILAGGSGTRLWPASNSKMPKQFIPIENGKSLLQLTLERALSLGISGEIVIITLRDQLKPILVECEKIGEGRGKIKVVPEPAARNTAPAIAIASEYLVHKADGDGSATAAVLTADHLITPFERFSADMEKADTLARQGNLVTFGIPPTRPETGYGYIESGRENEFGYLVKSFREKPDEKTARIFLDKGNYYWNSGMFAFQVGRYLEELAAHSPDIADVFRRIGAAGTSRRSGEVEIVMEGSEVERIYQKSPKDSIDYAVMEKSSKSAMVRASFDWNDVGSWEEMAALYEEKSGEGPAAGGEQAAAGARANINGSGEELVTVESQGNFVYSDLPVALCGVEDLMVVVKNGAVLVARKGAGQQVKQVVQQFGEMGREDIL